VSQDYQSHNRRNAVVPVLQVHPFHIGKVVYQ